MWRRPPHCLIQREQVWPALQDLLGVAHAWRAITPPSARPKLHSVGVGCGRCLRGGIGIAQQGIHPGVETGEPLVLLPELLCFFLDLLGFVPDLLGFDLWPPADFVYSCCKRFSLSSSLSSCCYGFAGLRLRSLLDVVNGTPVEHRQQAPPGRQSGDPGGSIRTAPCHGLRGR